MLRALLVSARLYLVTPDVSRRRKQRVRVPRLPNINSQPPRDEHGLMQAACCDLADELGFTRDAIWYWWRQIAVAVEMNTGYPRAVCETYALECVRFGFDKRGAIAD